MHRSNNAVIMQTEQLGRIEALEEAEEDLEMDDLPPVKNASCHCYDFLVCLSERTYFFRTF